MTLTAGRTVGGMGAWRRIVAAHRDATPADARGPAIPVAPAPTAPPLDPSDSVTPLARPGAAMAPEPSPAALASLPTPSADLRAPMGSADLVFGADGRVAWGDIWDDFCELALIGGPPHRGDLLVAPPGEDALADPAGAARVREELARGLAQTTGWPVREDVVPGWIGLDCPDEEAAAWMALAVLAENVDARYDGRTLLVPAGPAFALKGEIKNVVTAVAKTWHFWARHGMR